jgi:hypothetical protein
MGDLVQSAKLFANENHDRIFAGRNPAQRNLPEHRKAVVQIVASVTRDEETIAAAWLHDIVEDTPVTICDLERKFGEGVARIVAELTIPAHIGYRSGLTRVALAKKHFAHASAAAKTVKLADLINGCGLLQKNDPGSLAAYAAEAQELCDVLEGGDPHLLKRLRRNLETYAADSPPDQAALATPRFKPLAIPIASLRVFEQAIRAQFIAEPLISFDADLEPAELLQAMTLAEIPVAGVHRDSTMWGFVEAASLRKGGAAARGKKFAGTQIVTGRSSLPEVIDVLTRHDRCFVSVQGSVTGVISRSDLHKPAVRMWLFGIITFAELEATERIRRKWPNESWTALLAGERVARARQLCAERARRRDECELLDCLQLSDKLNILLSDPSQRDLLGIPSASGAQRASREFETLRNKLAHAQSFVEKDWAQVARLARRIHQILDQG